MSRGELPVLALVVADGDLLGLVQKDVRCHEDGVGEQAHAVALLALGLLLEGDHARELAVGSDALEQPVELCVVGDLALDEDRADLGVEARGEVAREQVRRVLTQGVRLDVQGERVQIHDAVVRVAVLLLDPAPQRPEVVAEVQPA